MKDWVADLLERLGVPAGGIEGWSLAATIVLVLAAAWLADRIAQRVLLRLVRAFTGRTRAVWDDKLVEAGLFERLAHLAPALVVYAAAPMLFPPGEDGVFQGAAALVQRLANVWMVLVVVRAVSALLDAAAEIYYLKPANHDKPLRAYVQLGKILLAVAAAIIIVGTLMDRSPWGLLTGLGAMTAVILLVFRDTILGLVASVQITSYDLVRKGDWLEMPEYAADGDVVDISLHTVRVQNWDKTITAIPTHAFLDHSFKNWRGMEESGGRRIKRAVSLDMTSVRFLRADDITRLRKVQALRGYLDAKEQELEDWNHEQGTDPDSPVNGRRLTNLGTFRAYVEHYLHNHPLVHSDMTFLVRQLPPGPGGIPVEVYVFSREQRWAQYEALQADIFDHLLAVLPEFGLRVFQDPTGADLRMLQSAR